MSHRHRNAARRATPFRTAANKDAARLAELERRVLGDLEDCRLAWEKAHDPVALLVAVEMAEALEIPLPQWLCDAVLVVMAAAFDIAHLGRLNLPDLWAKTREQAQDAQRAAGALAYRTHPSKPHTLKDAYRLGAKAAAEHAGADHTGDTEAKASYLQAIRGLQENEGLYHGAPPGWLGRVVLALSTLPAAVAAPLQAPNH
jgi:hypothetical protein